MDRNARIRELFALAVELPADEREPFLIEQCGGDADLQRELAQLLAADAEESPALVDRPLLAAPLEPDEIGLASNNATRPQRIGPYRIVGELGDGGFGIVYLAEQQQPVRRQVALKVLKPGMGHAEVLARFAAERQALARMEHPSLARFYDCGTTESGQPFFVMEYVDGCDIAEYCDEHRLTTAQRIALLRDVCLAVQHAHGKGVIHRDLKPANVLVSTVDGRPLPKVIDFGIAKAITERLTEQTLETLAGRMIGTPEYMSPEQAGRGESDIDTRSDVYALGVMLFELLTGRRPIPLGGSTSLDLPEMVRRIRDEIPPRPSSRFAARQAKRDDMAQRRGTTANQLARQLRGDLDWICAKALEKDRSRRYETAAALAEDLQRYLAQQPIAARPPSARYRFARFVDRNRIASVATLCIATALVVGIVISLIGLGRAREEAQRSNEAVVVLRELLQLSDPDVSNDPATTLAILERNEARLVDVLPGDTATEARVRRIIGTAYWNLGRLEPAAQQLERALELADADPSTKAVTAHEILWPAAWVTWQTNDSAVGNLWRRMFEGAGEAFVSGVDGPRRRQLADRARALASRWLDAVGTTPTFESTTAFETAIERSNAPDARRQWRIYADWLVACGDSASLNHRAHALGRQLLDRAQTIYRTKAALPPNHSSYALVALMRLENAGRSDDHELGARLAEDTMLRLRRDLGSQHWLPSLFEAWLGTFEARLGDRDDDAILHLQNGIRVVRRVGNDNQLVRVGLTDLVNLLERRGRTAEAEERRQQLVALMQTRLDATAGPTNALEARAVFPGQDELLAAWTPLFEGRQDHEADLRCLNALLEIGDAAPPSERRLRRLLATSLLRWQKTNAPNLPDLELRQRLLDFACVMLAGYPNQFYAYFELARLSFLRRDYTRCCEFHRRCLKLCDTYPRLQDVHVSAGVRVRLGATECRRGNDRVGLDLLLAAYPEVRALRARGGEMDTWTLAQIVAASARLGRFERDGRMVHRITRELMQLDSAAPGLVRVAWSFALAPNLSAKDYELARQAAAIAQNAASDSWQSLRTSGALAYRLGDDASAITVLEQGIVSGGANQAPCWIFLAFAKRSADDEDGAREAWQQAAQILATTEQGLDLPDLLAEAQRRGFQVPN